MDMLLFSYLWHKSKEVVGFTLVELSIVLVIIGLLTGGILAGKDLIKAAETRSVISDVEKYKTAVYTFKLKHNCLPGDCPNATTYFGARNADNTACLSTTPTIASPTLTCNGDGNELVADGSEEPFLFWQHLANANLIKGQYTGIHEGADIRHHVLALNSPTTAIAGVGFGFSHLNYPSGDGGTYGMNYGNMFWLGKPTIHRPQDSFFTPKEAYGFDQKIDDGKPATGFVIMRSNVAAWGVANACTTSTSATDYNGVYATTNTTQSCAFMIKSGL